MHNMVAFEASRAVQQPDICHFSMPPTCQRSLARYSSASSIRPCCSRTPQVGHPRTFSRRSSRICLGIASFYLVWIVVCSHFNGVFPYPFLNKMPWPQVSVSCSYMPNLLQQDVLTRAHWHRYLLLAL